jgi:flagellar biosynthesis/type III secretory pathway protein FliH
MPVPSLDIVLPIQVKRIEKSNVPAAMSDDTSHGAGFSAGYEEGRLRAEWEGKRQREKDNARGQGLMKVLENLHREYEGLLSEHLPDLIQGALNRVFRHHPFTAEEISKEVCALLAEMEHAGRISLECCPTEAEGLADRLHVAQVVPDGTKWSLERNEALQSGEFILKSDLGDVDGRHSSRIRQIHLALEAAS